MVTMNKLKVLSHMLFHLTETGLQTAVAFMYLQNSNSLWFGALLGVTFAPLLVINIASLVWIYRMMDFTGRRPGEILCIFLHVLQLGPLWRSFKLFLAHDHQDLYELCRLRLVQVSLQNGLFIVLMGYLNLAEYRQEYSLLDITTVAVSLFSMTYTYTCQGESKSGKLLMLNSHAKSEVQNHKRCSECRDYGALMVHFCHHLFCIASRLLAILLLTRATQWWSCLLLGCHFACFGIITFVKDELSSIPRPQKCIAIFSHIVLLFAQIFDYINIQCYNRCFKITVYYTLIAIENIIITLIWVLTNHRSPSDIVLLVLIHLGYICGVLFLLVSKKCATDNKLKTCSSYLGCCNVERCGNTEKKGTIKQLLVENPDTQKTYRTTGQDNRAFESKLERQGESSPKVKNASNYPPTSQVVLNIAKDIKDLKQTQLISSSYDLGTGDSKSLCQAKRTSANNSDADVSSNSRNTNTLDFSSDNTMCNFTQDMTDIIDSIPTPNQYENKENKPVTHSTPCKAKQQICKEHDRLGESLNNNCQGKNLIVENQLMKKKVNTMLNHQCSRHLTQPKPLEPPLEETWRYRGGQAVTLFKRSRSLSSPGFSSASNYRTATPSCFSQTETCSDTFCEYCDNHYWDYYTVQTSSSSDSLYDDLDFDLNMTWPPSRRLTIVNLNNLPTKKSSPDENVSKWLQELPSDIETLDGEDEKKQNETDMQSEKLNSRFGLVSSIHNDNNNHMWKEHCLNKDVYSQPHKVIGRKKQLLLKFCSLRDKPSFKPKPKTRPKLYPFTFDTKHENIQRNNFIGKESRV